MTSLVVGLKPILSSAATEPPAEHIHFLAEHLAEAVQDARYYAMPWPTGDYSVESWLPLVSVAASSVSQGFATADGHLLALGVSTSWHQNWSAQLVAFHDRFSISGSQTTNVLLPHALNSVPLDLPETALFSNPRGELVHYGAGIIVAHQLVVEDSNWQWDVIGGLLWEKMEMNNFTFNYALTGGLDAGIEGILDHSGDFQLTNFVLGIQARKSFAEHYTIIPRFVFGQPAKAGPMRTRLTSPKFDISTASTAAKTANIGDPFGYFGMTIRDNRSGWEADVGATLGFAVYEYLAHEGVNAALVISVTWRGQ